MMTLALLLPRPAVSTVAVATMILNVARVVVRLWIQNVAVHVRIAILANIAAATMCAPRSVANAAVEAAFVTLGPYVCYTMDTKLVVKIPVAASSPTRAVEAAAIQMAPVEVPRARKPHRQNFLPQPPSRKLQSLRPIQQTLPLPLLRLFPLFQASVVKQQMRHQSHPSPSPPSPHNLPWVQSCEPLPPPSHSTTTPSSSLQPPLFASNHLFFPPTSLPRNRRLPPWPRIARLQKIYTGR